MYEKITGRRSESRITRQGNPQHLVVVFVIVLVLFVLVPVPGGSYGPVGWLFD
jgi:hypothetical protein